MAAEAAADQAPVPAPEDLEELRVQLIDVAEHGAEPVRKALGRRSFTASESRPAIAFNPLSEFHQALWRVAAKTARSPAGRAGFAP